MIPRCFHSIWWGDGQALPEVFAGFGQTWLDHNPGWSMTSWDEVNLFDLQNNDVYVRAHELAPGFEGQLRSDIARLEILYDRGGVYVDSDFECFKSIEPLLEGVDCFVAWELQDQVANNAIFGAVPGHPFVKKLIDELPKSIASNPGKRPSQVSGPRFLTAQLRATPNHGVTIFPRSHFYAIGCRDLHRLYCPPGRDEYARHHWNNQQRLRRKRRR